MGKSSCTESAEIAKVSDQHPDRNDLIVNFEQVNRQLSAAAYICIFIADEIYFCMS